MISPVNKLVDLILEYNYKFKLFRAEHGFLNIRDLQGEFNWKNKSPVFVVSTGRTGTKFIANFFNQFDDIFSKHEPDPDLLKLGNNYATNRVSATKAVKIFSSTRKIILNQLFKLNYDRYLESNNRLYSLIPIIKQSIPNSKFIHIVRDGRDVVRSGMSRNYYESNDPFPRIKATDFPQDPWYSKWNKMSRFEKVCWWWQKKDNFIRKSVQNDYSITLKFENIFNGKEDYPGMKKLAEFIGVSLKNIPLENRMNNKCNSTKQYSIPHWKNWTDEHTRSFLTIAGDQMQKYNYL